jgi:pimeloyl-ACP methyl ester carboxylesterase
MNLRAEVEFDVSEPVGETASISATVVSPSANVRNTAVIAVPGGTYSRWYWDADANRLPGYSFAEHLANSGHVVVAVDNVGTGASSVPHGVVTPEQMAAALHRVAQLTRARLAEGSLAPGLGAIPDTELFGVGHSLGATFVAMQQGAHASYDRVGIWGMTALAPSGVDIAAQVAASVVNLRLTAGADQDAQFVRMPRAGLRPFFYGNFVEEDVMQADEAAATSMSVLGGASAGAHGYIAEAAAAISVPVFLVFGEQDLSEDPRREPTAYSSCNDLTLFVLRGSAHCHNLAPTRRQLWDRTLRWLGSAPGK